MIGQVRHVGGDVDEVAGARNEMMFEPLGGEILAMLYSRAMTCFGDAGEGHSE
jgi:hypothetical protein